MVRTFMIGGIAGAASVFGNTPVDVVKTRMQVSSGQICHNQTFIMYLLCACVRACVRLFRYLSKTLSKQIIYTVKSTIF